MTTLPAQVELRLTLPEQVDRLRRVLSLRKARAAVERAFRLKELAHSRPIALSYEDAAIDWKDGQVTLAQGDRRPFTPTALAVDFERHFAHILAGVAPSLRGASTHPAKPVNPTSKDAAEFSKWWAERTARGSPPTTKDAVQAWRERGLSRKWVRAQIGKVPSNKRRPAGGQKRGVRE